MMLEPMTKTGPAWWLSVVLLGAVTLVCFFGTWFYWFAGEWAGGNQAPSVLGIHRELRLLDRYQSQRTFVSAILRVFNAE